MIAPPCTYIALRCTAARHRWTCFFSGARPRNVNGDTDEEEEDDDDDDDDDGVDADDDDDRLLGLQSVTCVKSRGNGAGGS